MTVKMLKSQEKTLILGGFEILKENIASRIYAGFPTSETKGVSVLSPFKLLEGAPGKL